jgi:hypothetical protein
MKGKGTVVYIWEGGKAKRTHHGSISLDSALQTVCSPYIYQRMAIFSDRNNNNNKSAKMLGQ